MWVCVWPAEARTQHHFAVDPPAFCVCWGEGLRAGAVQGKPANLLHFLYCKLLRNERQRREKPEQSKAMEASRGMLGRHHIMENKKKL